MAQKLPPGTVVRDASGSVGTVGADGYLPGENPATQTTGIKPPPVVGTGPDIQAAPGSMDARGPDAVSSAQEASDQFKQKLPDYLGSQYAAAGDKAREGLAQDIQNTKASANSRGLLYSGLEAGGEAQDKAQESSKLAGDIQSINTNAQQQGFALEQNAVDQAKNAAVYDTSMQNVNATASQTAYEQALGEQQSMNDFYAGLASGIGQFGGGLAATLTQGNN